MTRCPKESPKVSQGDIQIYKSWQFQNVLECFNDILNTFLN